MSEKKKVVRTKINMSRYFESPRLYTDPPAIAEYDWVLFPLGSIGKFKDRTWKHGILDTGISAVFKPPFEYPKGFFEKWEKARVENTWKVVPDYRDITSTIEQINHNSSGNKLQVPYDTIERTFENLQKYYKIELQDELLPVIQHKKVYTLAANKKLFANTVRRFKREVNDSPPQLAVSGYMGKTGNDMLATHCFSLLRREFPETWIHIFGGAHKIMNKVAHLIDSWDTRSWGFARQTPNRKLLGQKGIVKKFFINKQEELDFFVDFLKTVGRITNTTGRRRQAKIGEII